MDFKCHYRESLLKNFWHNVLMTDTTKKDRHRESRYFFKETKQYAKHQFDVRTSFYYRLVK